MTLDRSATSRRSFLKLGAVAALAVSPVAAFADAALAALPKTGERWLKFDNLHTGEKLRTVYWQNGSYLKASLDDINHILRDFRTEEIRPIDTDLLDLLNVLQRRLETRQPIEIISGYRSPRTNAMLRARSSGVARNSYHMRGMAIDLRVPDRELIHVRRAALDMERGGVGYYPSSGFVHVDVGPIRAW